MKLDNIIFPLWQLLPTLLLLSAIAFADGPPRAQTNGVGVRHRSRGKVSDGEVPVAGTRRSSRKKRQLFDGLPSLRVGNLLGRALDGLDFVLKSRQNFDIFQCVERFGCEMLAPLVEEENENPAAEGEAEASEAEAPAEESSSTGETRDNDDAAAGGDEDAEVVAKDDKMPDTHVQKLLQQMLQSLMVQPPVALPSPFMPFPFAPQWPPAFNPFLTPGMTPLPSDEASTPESPKDQSEELPTEATTEPETTTIPPSNEHNKRHVQANGLVHSAMVPRHLQPYQRPRRLVRKVLHPRRKVYTRQLRPNGKIQNSPVHPSNYHPSKRVQLRYQPQPLNYMGRPNPQTDNSIRRVSTNRQVFPNAEGPQASFRATQPSLKIKYLPEQNRRFASMSNRRPIGSERLTRRRLIKVKREEESWLSKIFGKRRRRAASDPPLTIEEIKEIKHRIRRSIHRELRKLARSDDMTTEDVLEEVVKQEDEAASPASPSSTTSSLYPIFSAALRGYRGNHTTCEDLYKNCPTSTDAMIQRFTELPDYFPSGFNFRERIPRPFRYLLPN